MVPIPPQKVVVVGAGPVGALAALYAAGRGDNVEIYELRAGMQMNSSFELRLLQQFFFVSYMNHDPTTIRDSQSFILKSGFCFLADLIQFWVYPGPSKQ